MRFGIIGTAHMHINEMAEAFIGMGHTCVGVLDYDGPSAAVADQYHVALFESVTQLTGQKPEFIVSAAINDRKIEVLSICYEHMMHGFFDKPVVLDRQAYDTLEHIIMTGRIQIGLMLSMRFHPAWQMAWALTERGEIGRLVSIEGSNPHKLNPKRRPPWHFDKAQSGGLIPDLLIHTIDLALSLADSPMRSRHGYVQKNILPEYPGFYDSTKCWGVTENGILVSFSSDWLIPSGHRTWGDLRMNITGTKGRLEVLFSGTPVTEAPVLYLFREGSETVEVSVDDSGAHNVFNDFCDRLDGKPHCITHKDILRASLAAVMLDEAAEVVVNV